MAQTSENVECRILGEFVDDASRTTRSHPRPAKQSADTSLEGLVRRIANEMAVPQFNLTEIVQKVMSAVGCDIEQRVRQELQEGQRREDESYNDSFTG